MKIVNFKTIKIMLSQITQHKVLHINQPFYHFQKEISFISKLVFQNTELSIVLLQNMNKNQCQKVQEHILKRFQIIQKLGSGAYGYVYKVKDKYTHQVYALKKIFDAFQHSTDAQRTFREIEILKQTNHPNIIKLYETYPSQTNQDVYILFEYMQSDLHYAISDNIMKDGHFKYITYQIAKSLKYLHTAQLIHRDLKPSNVLVNSDCKIKLCDFGLVRSINNTQNSKINPLLTEKVATRWYRAPQVLMGSRKYSTPIDIWSFACIIYEMIQRRPMFPGDSTKDQLIKILQYTGIPSEQDKKSIKTQSCLKIINQISPNVKVEKQKLLKNLSPQFRNLLEKMLLFNPSKRPSIQDILCDPIFKKFRKISEEIVPQGKIDIPIDDNNKLTVDQYRRLIYNRAPQQKSNQLHRNNKGQTDLKPLKKIKSCQTVSLYIKHQYNPVKKPRIQSPNFDIKKSMEYLSSNINNSYTNTTLMQNLNKSVKKYTREKDAEKLPVMDKTVADISQLSNSKQICMTRKKQKRKSPKQIVLKSKSKSKQFIWFSPNRSKIDPLLQIGSPKKPTMSNTLKSYQTTKSYNSKHFLFGLDHKNQF